MDSNISRWAQIIFWTRDDLAELHKREVRHYAHSRKLDSAGKSPTEWRDLGYILEMQDRNQLIPYWPRNLEESERSARMTQWERRVFPIWKGIQGRQGEDASEIELLHRQDRAIFDSGIRPDRVTSMGADALRRRAAAGERYQRATQ